MLSRACLIRRVPLCVRQMAGPSGLSQADGVMPTHKNTSHKYRDEFLEHEKHTEVHFEPAELENVKVGKIQTLLREKPGPTGAAIIVAGLASATVSKGFVELDADVLAGGFLGAVTYTLVKKAGPSVIEALDNRAKGIHTTMSEGKNMQIEAFDTAITEEQEAAASLAVAGEVFDVKRELAAVELEAEYRRRIKLVHTEVKRRLDYQVELENTKKAFIRDHIVNWLEAKVIESITPEQEEANINQCIAKLATLA